MSRRPSAWTTAAAWVGALAFHAALLTLGVTLEAPTQAPAQDEGSAPALAELEGGRDSAQRIALISEAELGALVVAREAFADRIGTSDTHPLPSHVDRSGELAAQSGSQAGGPFRDTTRRDHEDQRAEIWNGSARAQVAIEARGRLRTTSPEAVTRDDNAGFDATTDRGPRTRLATPAPRPGERAATDEADATGTDARLRDFADADPVLEDLVAARRDGGKRGRLTERDQTAVSDRGSASADVPKRGRLVGALDASAASDSRDPAPFELASAGTGGAEGGASGAAKRDGSAEVGRGRGTASSKAARVGAADEALRASRGDPYFRDLYRQLDRHVVFPRDLAVNLEQGTVVARFVLNPDGSISAIKVDKTSGFQGFDDALLAALRVAGPFGKVPDRILSGARSVRIIAPYRFSNPLIR